LIILLDGASALYKGSVFSWSKDWVQHYYTI
jgi:hypothetical protein